jgi:16S rRNA (guanine966-N2)-methyltransferase
MKLSKRALGTVRLIAGKHRSRIVHFNPDLGVRPTTDRLRETIFNWLNDDLFDARCLDLFSGSGAMGFEAASRGAAHVLMSDAFPKVVQQLKENVQALKEESVCQIINYKWAPKGKPLSTVPFNVIFLDPPYKEEMLIPAIEWCYATGAADKDTLVCFEAEKWLDLSELNEKFEFIKHKKTKHIQYGLLKLK